MRGAIRTVAVAWAALLALLAGTVVLAALPLGPFAPAASFGIAVAKAALIGWVFMHLRSERGLSRLIALGVVAWVLILIGLTMLDVATRT